MAAITATQADPAAPTPEEWRPTSTANLEAKERAAFLNGWEEGGDKGKPDTPEPDDDDEDLADEDEDIEDDDDEEEEVVAKKPAPKAKAKPAEPEPEPDDDSDLDEDEEKPEADPAIAKGMQKLQKQEKRMREQLDTERAQWRAEHSKAQEALQAEKTAAAEAKAELARLKQRAKIDPASVLEELGVDDFDYAAKQAYVRSKDGGLPANKEAAARLQEIRELKAKQAESDKKWAEREKTEADERKEAAMRTEVETYLGGVVKSAAAVKQATCIQKLLAADQQAGFERLKAAAGRLYQGGKYPDERAVVKEAERQERAMLRRYGINPRTLAASPTQSTEKTGKVAKAGKAKRADDGDLKAPSREELLNEDWT